MKTRHSAEQIVAKLRQADAGWVLPLAAPSTTWYGVSVVR